MKPKTVDSYEYGFRVPLIAVFPYAKAAPISHVPHDFGSILKFIENLYGPALGYADTPADDLSDCFDFTKAPVKFQTMSEPLNAEDFLNDHRAPEVRTTIESAGKHLQARNRACPAN